MSASLGCETLPGAGNCFKRNEAAPRGLKLELQSLEVRGPDPDLDGAFRAAAKGRADALIVVSMSCSIAT